MRASALLITGLALTACAPAADPDPPLVVAEREQAWALGDGVVTAREYRTAVDRFSACVRTAGYAVHEPVLSPIDGVSLLVEITPAGAPDVYNDVVQRCDLANLSLVEPAHVEAQAQLIAEPLRGEVARCLGHRGIQVRGGERNVTEFAAVAHNDQAVIGCVTDAAHRAFPDLPDVLTIRK